MAVEQQQDRGEHVTSKVASSSAEGENAAGQKLMMGRQFARGGLPCTTRPAHMMVQQPCAMAHAMRQGEGVEKQSREGTMYRGGSPGADGPSFRVAQLATRF